MPAYACAVCRLRQEGAVTACPRCRADLAELAALAAVVDGLDAAIAGAASPPAGPEVAWLTGLRLLAWPDEP